MSTMKRFATLWAATAVVAAAVVAMSGSASAFMQRTVTIRAGQETRERFNGIPGNYPGTSVVNFTPSGCGNATNTAAAQAVCDRVPLRIEIPPGLDEADDFFAQIEVTWRPSADLNDLDIYLWDNQQIAKRNDPASTTFTRLAESAGSTQPEAVALFRPELGDYNLTIINWAGPNLEYTVTARIVIGTFEQPFELLAPSAVGDEDEVVEDQSGGGDGPPVDFSADGPGDGFGSGTGDFFQAPFAGDLPPILGQVAVLPDADFSSFSPSTFDRELSAPPPTADLPARLAGLRAPGDVSSAVLVFWFVGLPLALVGAAWVLLMRRSQGAFAAA